MGGSNVAAWSKNECQPDFLKIVVTLILSIICRLLICMIRVLYIARLFFVCLDQLDHLRRDFCTLLYALKSQRQR